MMNESFLGIFDDDMSDAPAGRQPPTELGGVSARRRRGPPVVGREPSWAGLPRHLNCPLLQTKIGGSRAGSRGGRAEIADAWDSVPLPNTLHERRPARSTRRAEMPAMPEADLLTPLWAPDPPKGTVPTFV